MNARARAQYKRRIERIRAELRAKDDGLVNRGGELMLPRQMQMAAHLASDWISEESIYYWRNDPTYNMRRK